MSIPTRMITPWTVSLTAVLARTVQKCCLCIFSPEFRAGDCLR